MGNVKFFVLCPSKNLSFRNEDAWGNLGVSKQSDLFPNAFGRLVYTNITDNIPSLKLTAASLQGTENALRALLRFMKADKEVALCFPSPSYGDLSSKESVNCFLHGFPDASFAPYRFNSRRGITGGAVFCEGSLVRTVARQQQFARLSSCEAGHAGGGAGHPPGGTDHAGGGALVMLEVAVITLVEVALIMYALQVVSQEAVAYAAFTHRLYFGIDFL